VSLVQPDRLVRRVSRVHLASLVQLVHRGRKDLPASQARPVLPDLKASKDPLGLLVQLVQRARRVLREYRGHLVPRERPDQPVPRAPPAQPVPRESKDRPAQLASRELPARWVRKDRRVSRDLLVLPALRAHKAIKVRLAPRDLRAPRAPQGPWIRTSMRL
jgi:hypothetical protein